MHVLLTTLLVLPTLAACASITTGTTQSIAVDTSPDHGAACTLSNDKGSWVVPGTPGSATVARAYGPLTVACEHDNGAKGATSLQSTTQGAAFGNILAGGLIGAAVDMSSGAAYGYPPMVNVSLTQGEGGRKRPPGQK